jgi:uncharacterized protein YndB with AHSA1/START domain
MRCDIHEFDPRQGGSFRISLTYDSVDRAGKSGSNTDTYHGRFIALDPDERVVEELEFETADPAFQGVMTMTTTLTEVEDGGTEVVIVHEGLPTGVRAVDNETGTRMALANLAALLEADSSGDGSRRA